MILNDHSLNMAVLDGRIQLQEGNPHNAELVRPNSLDTTIGPVVYLEVPTEWEVYGYGENTHPLTPDDLRCQLQNEYLLGVHKDKHGNFYFRYDLENMGCLTVPSWSRVIAASNERLKGMLDSVTAQAVLRSGAAHAGWLLGGGFAEAGFGHDPEGQNVESSTTQALDWVNGPEWEGVVFSFALTNASRSMRVLRYQDRLVQLVFSAALAPNEPYHVRESSNYKQQKGIEDRLKG